MKALVYENYAQDDTVTLRMRDSMEQNRIKISELDQTLSKETAFP